MKFNSIIIFFVFCNSRIEPARTGRLSGQENESRLESCGNETFPQPSNSIDGVSISKGLGYKWIQYIINSKSFEHSATVSFITSRHFLTTSAVLMEGFRWLSNGESLNKGDCVNKKDLEVPKNLLKLLTLQITCNPDCNETIALDVVKAWILSICNEETGEFRRKSSFLLIGEVKTNQKKNFPCLVEKLATPGSSHDVYGTGFSDPGETMLHRQVKIINVSSEYINTEYYLSDYGDYKTPGDALTNVGNDQKTTLSGIGIRNSTESATKFFNLFNYLELLCDLIGVCQKGHGALTKQENLNRLKSCGKSLLPQPADSNNPKEIPHQTGFLAQEQWWIYVEGEVKDKLPQFASASMISPRNFITSSLVVMDESKKWISDGIQHSLDCVNRPIEYLTVPTSVLNKLVLKLNPCLIQKGQAHCSKPKLVRAFILNICADGMTTNIGYPMIVEIETKLLMTFPCLPESKIVAPKNMILKFDAYNHVNGEMQHTKLKFAGTANDLIHTEKYANPENHEIWGGLLVRVDQSKSILIGLAPPNSPSKDSNNLLFFDISKMHDVLCDLTGICKEEVVVIPPAHLTTSESPTSSTSESTLTSSESSGPSASPASAPTQPPKAPDSTTPSKMEPTSTECEDLKDDVDREYEAFEAQKPREDVDVNNDFFVDPDFLNSGIRKTWKFTLFVVLFLIFIR